PTPPQQPVPIPAPEPGPLEIDAITAERGSPVFPSCASWIWGGPRTVGSAVNLGFSTRMTTAGGVSCSFANLGGDPFGAGSLLLSPPPPPPPASLVEGGRNGTMSVTSPVTRCLMSLRFSTIQCPDQTHKARSTVLAV